MEHRADLRDRRGTQPSTGGRESVCRFDSGRARNLLWLLGPYSIGLLHVAPKWQGGTPLEENWIQRANARDFASLILYTETTLYGGTYGFGTVFRLDANGKEAVLHSFTGGADGQFPEAGLVQDAADNLYGTTYCSGGNRNYCPGPGTVFKVSKNGKETQVHAFTGGRDGGWPMASLTPDKLLGSAETAPRELPEMLAREKVFVSVRGSSIRVTPHVYNTVEDGERLIACLRRMPGIVACRESRK
jgi:uncharacterized repeat protein (TIGR03803 family)